MRSITASIQNNSQHFNRRYYSKKKRWELGGKIFYLQTTLTKALFLCILFIAFWIRVQGVGHFPAGQFAETDAHFYYWQASLISEHAHLLEHDLHRWLPVGRDLGQRWTFMVPSSFIPTKRWHGICQYLALSRVSNTAIARCSICSSSNTNIASIL